MGVYLRVDEWWHPWANTVAYRPLTSASTVNDQSWNDYNLTNNWAVQFGMYGGVDCSFFESGNSQWLSVTLPAIWNSAFTYSCWIYRLGYSSWPDSKSQVFMMWPLNSNRACFGLAINWASGWNDEFQVWTWGQDDNTWEYSQINQWEHVVVTNDGTTKKFYLNWVLESSVSMSINVTNGIFRLWSFTQYFQNNRWQRFYGYMSEFIAENKTRTDQEIASYYNSTKRNYGL